MNRAQEMLCLTALLLLLLALMVLASPKLSEGAPPPWVSRNVHVNGQTGSDTAGDGTPGNPYLTIDKALEVIGDDSHARIRYAGRHNKDINDTPTPAQADRYIRQMEDHHHREYWDTNPVTGRYVPDENVDTSSVAGLGITYQYVWGIVYNEDGLPNEKCIGYEPVVVPEAYDPAL